MTEGSEWGLHAHLPGLLHSLLGVALDLVAGMVGDLGHRLLEDGGRLPDGEGRVQVRLALWRHARCTQAAQSPAPVPVATRAMAPWTWRQG